MDIKEFLSETKNLAIIIIVLQMLIIFGLAFFYLDNMIELPRNDGSLVKINACKALPIVIEGEQMIISGLNKIIK